MDKHSFPNGKRDVYKRQGIAQQLYQKTTIEAKGFEETNLPDSFFDGVVGVAWWINAPGPDGLESDGSHRQAETLVTFIDN